MFQNEGMSARTLSRKGKHGHCKTSALISFGTEPVWFLKRLFCFCWAVEPTIELIKSYSGRGKG